MYPESAHFFQHRVPQLLKSLRSNDQPAWGLLNPQAMVEHLIGSWRISNGNATAKQVVHASEVPAYRSKLLAEPMTPNTKNPMMPEHKPPALRKPTLQAAVAQLEQEITAFFAHFKNHPETTPIHPMAGPLTQDEWLMFQTNHIYHHFRQFRLLED